MRNLKISTETIKQVDTYPFNLMPENFRDESVLIDWVTKKSAEIKTEKKVLHGRPIEISEVQSTPRINEAEKNVSITSKIKLKFIK